MQFRTTTCLIVVVAASSGFATTRAAAQTGGGYDLTWSSLDCGSATTSHGGSYALDATIGQPEAGNLAGGSYVMRGGFGPGSSSTPTDAPPDLNDGSAPLVFQLHGSTPNPFASATVIAFSLARDERVEMRIYDLAGRVVRTVLARSLPPGRHQVMWDARDDSGRRVAHGIYMLRLQAGAFQARRKLALMP